MASKKTLFTVANLFTLTRIIITPVIVCAMVLQSWGVAFWLFLLASFTDIIDGFWARWFNERTLVGACLDPIADKILLISCFFTLAFVQSPLFSIPHWFVYFVLIKEALLLLGICCYFVITKQIVVKPTWLGKGATLAQIIFIIWLFSCYFFHWVPIKTYYTMLGLLLLLSGASLLHYAYRGLVMMCIL